MTRRFRSLRFVMTSATCVLLGTLSAAHAQNVALTPDEAGPDYVLQGEYHGWQRPLVSARSTQRVGLQVIARGDGKFLATKYYGGLPGMGWAGGPKYEYTGETRGDLLLLHADDYSIEVDGKSAKIFANDGRLAGELTKVQRASPTLGAPPPAGAEVLFDGTNTDKFTGAEITEDALLKIGTETAEAYDDFRLHLEFRLPFEPHNRGQGRANSGLYLQSRYEVQILDSFGLEGVENEGGAVYTRIRPNVNMVYPPLSWQTYDVDFQAARFDDAGNRVAPARLTVWHNGVLIHSDIALPGKTGHGQPEGPAPLPTKLQDHSNPVVFRNIWLLRGSSGGPRGAEWVNLPLSGPPVPDVAAQSPGSLPVFGVLSSRICIQP